MNELQIHGTGRKKSLLVFECDSHIDEPPEIWDKYIPQNQQAFAKTHFYIGMRTA